MSEALRYCGRDFSQADLEVISNLIAVYCRATLSLITRGY
ncbi:unnamed protein product [Acidithrix sp. C25]|nr:unnamed protein product [Acidithrix sp. C25]